MTSLTNRFLLAMGILLLGFIKNSHALALDEIYPDHPKKLFQTTFFERLDQSRQKGDFSNLKKVLSENPDHYYYGILRFGKTVSNQIESSSYRPEYENSIWILIYSYQLHPNHMILLIDLEQDGYLYNETDLSIDLAGYLGMNSFKIFSSNNQNHLQMNDQMIRLNLPPHSSEGSKKEMTLTHGSIKSEYYQHYQNALICQPKKFTPYSGTSFMTGRTCSNLLNLTQRNGNSSQPVTNVSNEFSLYRKITCSGVGKLNYKCTVFPRINWRLFK